MSYAGQIKHHDARDAKAPKKNFSLLCGLEFPVAHQVRTSVSTFAVQLRRNFGQTSKRAKSRPLRNHGKIKVMSNGGGRSSSSGKDNGTRRQSVACPFPKRFLPGHLKALRCCLNVNDLSCTRENDAGFLGAGKKNVSHRRCLARNGVHAPFVFGDPRKSARAKK